MIKKISKYRDPLMGIAILWVLLHHSGLNLSGPLFAIKRTGYGGVEIFVFVSGLGCAYSFLKDKDILSFYKRRFVRIYPHYLPVMLVFLLMNGESISISELLHNLLGNITGFSYWSQTGLSFNWYIPAIIMFYVLTPLFIEITNDRRGGVMLIVVFFIAGFCFSSIDNLLLSISRIPMYVFGIMAGKLLKNGEMTDEIPTIRYIIILVAGAVGMMALILLYRYQEQVPEDLYNVFYPCILTTPALMLGACWIFERIGDNCLGRMVMRFLTFAGRLSLDIYLIHIVSFSRVGKLLEGIYDHQHPHPMSIRNVLLWICVMIMTIIVSWGYSKAVNCITCAVTRCKLR